MKIIPANIVAELSGSLSTKVKESNYKVARGKAGRMLAKKYRIRQ